MPSYTVPAFPIGNYVLVDVVDYDNDGVTPDTTEALTVTSALPGVATAVVNPGNPRQVRITGVAAGSTTVTVTAPGVPAPNALAIMVTVSPLPNLSKIEATTHQGPFPV